MTREEWDEAQRRACEKSPDTCTAAYLLPYAVVTAPFAYAGAVRGVVALGPAGPVVMNAITERGGDLVSGIIVPEPPSTFFQTIGFAVGRAFNFVRDLFSGGE